MKIRFLLFLLIPALAGGGAFAYYRLRPLPLSVEKVEKGIAIEAVYASGTIESEQRATLRARISGPILSLLVEEGSKVKKGDLLIQVDPSSLSNDVQKGKVELEAAQLRSQYAPQLNALRNQAFSLTVQLKQAQRNLERQKKLMSSHASTQQQLEDADSTVESLKAQIRANRSQQKDIQLTLKADTARQKAGLASLEVRENEAEIRAPFDGIILRTYVKRGDTVNPNRELLEIADLSKLRIEASIKEEDIGNILRDQQTEQPALPAVVHLYPFANETFSAHISKIYQDADRQQKSFQIHLLFDNLPENIRHSLRPGMSADMNIIIRKHENILLIPRSAITTKNWVWVVSQGKLEKRKVKTDISDLTQIEITSGVKEGEWVVPLDGTIDKELKKGKKVKALFPKTQSEDGEDKE